MSDLFKNIVKLPPPHTARSYSELTPVYTADEVAKTVASFEAELIKSNERVKELEKRNNNQSKTIEGMEENTQKLESEVCALLGRYGDIWYEGFHSAQEQQKNASMWCITDVSPDELLAMSEVAETEHLRKALSIDAETPRTTALNRFAIEQKRTGYYDSCIESGLNEGQANLRADIYVEQLSKEQENV
jgi:hypothetical protein